MERDRLKVQTRRHPGVVLVIVESPGRQHDQVVHLSPGDALDVIAELLEAVRETR